MNWYDIFLLICLVLILVGSWYFYERKTLALENERESLLVGNVRLERENHVLLKINSHLNELLEKYEAETRPRNQALIELDKIRVRYESLLGTLIDLDSPIAEAELQSIVNEHKSEIDSNLVIKRLKATLEKTEPMAYDFPLGH